MRAVDEGIEDTGTLDEAIRQADAVLSVCVPSGAKEIACAVASRGFKGIYLDANAIAPEHSREIGRLVENAGASFVDGGIIGLPPTPKRTARLYLCGPKACDFAKLFASTQTEAIVLDAPVGAASALKVCFAIFSRSFDF